MRLVRFISISVLIHIAIAVGIYYLPPAAVKKTQELAARLVSPDELRMPEKRPPAASPPVIRSRPLPPGTSRGPKTPSAPAARPYNPPPDESGSRPLVRGEGHGEGKTPPQGPAPDSVSPSVSGRPGGARPPESSGPSASGRSRLFDRSVTDAIARRDAGSGSRQDAAVTFDTKEYRYAGYMSRLRDRIQSVWVYPPDAIEKGIYGDLKLRFTIKKDGHLGKVELVRTSGYRTLDDAAIRALKEAEPYWPLPEEWGMDTYTILGHFVYSMYGYQLR